MVRFGVLAFSDGPGGVIQGNFLVRRERGRILVRLVDDRFLFAESLAAAVHASAPDIVVEHCSSRVALEGLPDVARGAGVVLVHLGPGRLTDGSAGEALLGLLALVAHPPIAAVVPAARRPLLRQAQRLGLKGFVPATAPLSVAIGAIRLIRSGGTFLPDLPDR